jgi:DNA-directed RNA polymerase subunit RPC12/RpoP
MTLRCEHCGGVVILVADNGAEYPQTRVEFYECDECGHEQREMLVA